MGANQSMDTEGFARAAWRSRSKPDPDDQGVGCSVPAAGKGKSDGRNLSRDLQVALDTSNSDKGRLGSINRSRPADAYPISHQCASSRRLDGAIEGCA